MSTNGSGHHEVGEGGQEGAAEAGLVRRGEANGGFPPSVSTNLNVP